MTELYAVIARSEDGEEGVVSYLNPDTGAMEPLIGSLKRAPELIRFGKALAQASGLELKFVKFSQRGILETFKPEELPEGEKSQGGS